MSSTTKTGLVSPGRIGIAARAVVAAGLLLWACSTIFEGGSWVFALAIGALGALIGLAAILRQPGCEVNLVWARLLGRTPLDCFLFGPIDRWEQRKSN